MKKYDIFISYRRDGGAETAKHLRDTLTERGYRVFLDIESLRSGQFDAELYRVIETTKDFLLILPPGGLDRCESEEDWVRLEIEHARKCGKNIIPILLKGFTFPETLPDSLMFLKTQNGLSANVEYYDAFIDNLIKYLKSGRRTPKSMRWIPALIILVVVAALVFGAVSYFSRYPRNASQRNLVSELSAYMAQNLQPVDSAGVEFNRLLDETIAFVDEKSLMTVDDLKNKYSSAYDNISGYNESLYEMNDDLKTALKSSPFDTGDLSGFIPTLKDEMEGDLNRIAFLYTYLPSVYATDENKAEKIVLLRYLNTLKEDSELSADNIFLSINETFLPVTEESALSDLKHEYLPKFTYIYAGKPDFISDLQTIRGKQEYNFNLQQELLEQSEADLQLLKEDTAKYFWSKGVYWLTEEDADLSGLAFELCRKYCNEQFVPCADSALLFVRNLDKHGLKGGVVVCATDNNASEGTIKPGDIIYEVCDVQVLNKSEFDASLTKGENRIKILRFDNDDYSMLSATYDAERGELSCCGLTE